MPQQIVVDQKMIEQLDLTSAAHIIESLALEPLKGVRTIRFDIEYPKAPEDPRELPEIPEVRLWFIRMDAHYPWLPYFLDWRAGELTRYAAMLVPHQFTQEGLVFNPEALELFVMNKVFTVGLWLHHRGIENRSELRNLAQTLGYTLDPQFFELM